MTGDGDIWIIEVNRSPRVKPPDKPMLHALLNLAMPRYGGEGTRLIFTNPRVQFILSPPPPPLTSSGFFFFPFWLFLFVFSPHHHCLNCNCDIPLVISTRVHLWFYRPPCLTWWSVRTEECATLRYGFPQPDAVWDPLDVDPEATDTWFQDAETDQQELSTWGRLRWAAGDGKDGHEDPKPGAFGGSAAWGSRRESAVDPE